MLRSDHFERIHVTVVNHDSEDATTHHLNFSLSHASPSQLSSPTQKNKIIKSPFQVHFTISSYWYLKKPSSSRVSGPILRRLRLVQTKPNRPLDAIASESHSSSGRFIPLPPLFIAIAHCHPLFPNLDFCSIYQISSPSHNSILSYSVFSYVLNLSHFQLTFCFVLFFLFFLFFFVEKTIVIVS